MPTREGLSRKSTFERKGLISLQKKKKEDKAFRISVANDLDVNKLEGDTRVPISKVSTNLVPCPWKPFMLYPSSTHFPPISIIPLTLSMWLRLSE